MMTIIERIKNDYLLGAVKLNGKVRYFLEPIAYWIMDYKSYDPEYRASENDTTPFRNNILTVDSSNAFEYIEALKEDEVSLTEIDSIKSQVDFEIPVMFLVDFDSKQFVSNFEDIEIEIYIPEGWSGIFDNPISYLKMQ